MTKKKLRKEDIGAIEEPLAAIEENFEENIEENFEDGSIRVAGSGTSPDGEEGVFATVSLFVSGNFNDETFFLV